MLSRKTALGEVERLQKRKAEVKAEPSGKGAANWLTQIELE